nr:hypothetical protein [Tanacetum cinerariifolium]
MALTDTIYEKVMSSLFPAAIRFALKTEKGRSSYLCNYGLCWPGRALSFLCQIPSYQTRLTSYQPAKGCEAGPEVRRMNLYLCTEGPAAAQLFERNAVVLVPIDKSRMPGRRSSTVGSRRVRFGSRARTRNRRCTILAATYFTRLNGQFSSGPSIRLFSKNVEP